MNSVVDNEWIVKSKYDGKRLDYWIKKEFPTLSFPNICKVLRKGLIKVNKRKATNSYVLKKDDLIKFYISLNIEKKKVSFSEKIISKSKEWVVFKNQNFIVFNKPSGIAVQGGTGVKINIDDLLSFFKFNNEKKPVLVHRIDKATSGLLIVARNLDSAQKLGKIFKSREIRKKYIAVVHGIPEKKNGLISKPIFVENKPSKATTYFSVVKTKKNKSLIIAYPLTGRKHQLRQHFNYIGNPIVGDKKYVLKNIVKDTSDKLFLHSFSLEFRFENNDYKFFGDLPEYFESKISEFNIELSLLKNKFNFRDLLNYVEIK